MNLQPNQFCSFQIDNKPKLGWLLYRKLCRFCALKILSTWPAALRKVADQTGPYDINAPAGRVGGSHRGEFICDGKFSNSLSLVVEYCVLRDHNCAEIFNRNYFDYMFQLIRLTSLECFD
jgi:hypothetical protein